MCGKCKEGCSKTGCKMHCIIKVLLLVGAINWGLVGLGMIFQNGNASWNVVHLILGSSYFVEGLVYVLVGAAAVLKIFGCKCMKCKGGNCKVEDKTNTPT
ncbi:MAG: DUF378 domain-containing protein [bacterium]